MCRLLLLFLAITACSAGATPGQDVVVDGAEGDASPSDLALGGIDTVDGLSNLDSAESEVLLPSDVTIDGHDGDDANDAEAKPYCKLKDYQCQFTCGGSLCPNEAATCAATNGCELYESCRSQCSGFPHPNTSCVNACANSAGSEGVKAWLRLNICRTLACVDFSQEGCVEGDKEPPCPDVCSNTKCAATKLSCKNDDACISQLACNLGCSTPSCLQGCKNANNNASGPLQDCVISNCY